MKASISPARPGSLVDARHPDAPRRSPRRDAASYVSLGDLAAGPLIPNPVAARSAASSPTTTTRTWRLRASAPLRDPSCSGAKTVDMTDPQEVEPAAQLVADRLARSGTSRLADDRRQRHRLLGNRSELHQRSTRSARPARTKTTPEGHDQIAERIAVTAPKVAAVLQGIHARAPSARVYVVNYPAIFPETGNGCWP